MQINKYSLQFYSVTSQWKCIIANLVYNSPGRNWPQRGRETNLVFNLTPPPTPLSQRARAPPPGHSQSMQEERAENYSSEPNKAIQLRADKTCMDYTSPKFVFGDKRLEIEFVSTGYHGNSLTCFETESIRRTYKSCSCRTPEIKTK